MLSHCVGRISILVLAGTTIGASLIPSDAVSVALYLDSAADRSAFRGWFTFLAEAQYYNSEGNRPAELVDCASLLRYAYREALRNHDDAWAREARLPIVPALPSVQQYSYPRIPIGPNLFRVAAGSGRGQADFALFADAKTLQRWNTFSIGRDVRRALPGDLLFFRREGIRPTYHSMIVLGRSHFEASRKTWVVYHTGPEAGSAGELRRKSIDDLLNYPDPQWRPVVSNTSFSGVFRWNILRQTQ